VQYGILFAVPYAVTAIIMIINSWHSDKPTNDVDMSRRFTFLAHEPHSERRAKPTLLDFLRPNVLGNSGPFAAMAPFGPFQARPCRAACWVSSASSTRSQRRRFAVLIWLAG